MKTPSPPVEPIAERLQGARKDAGYETALYFCEQYNHTASTYRGHERDARKIKLSVAEQYAKDLGVSLKWLLFGDETRDKETTPKPQISELAMSICVQTLIDRIPRQPATSRHQKEHYTDAKTAADYLTSVAISITNRGSMDSSKMQDIAGVCLDMIEGHFAKTDQDQ